MTVPLCGHLVLRADLHHHRLGLGGDVSGYPSPRHLRRCGGDTDLTPSLPPPVQAWSPLDALYHAYHCRSLGECADLNDGRRIFYQVPSLQDLFKTVEPEVILDFLKAASVQAFMKSLIVLA